MRQLRPRIPNLDDLTARQREIFVWMYEFTRDNGFQPSYRDMARQFHFNSINGLVSHMRALQKKGFLLIPGNETRSIRFKVRPDGQPFTGFADKVQSTGLEPRLPEEADFDGGDQES